MTSTLILYYDTMWGMVHAGTVPQIPDCKVTLDRRRYAQANVVVFHLPEWKWRRWLGLPRKLPGQLWTAWSIESDVNYPYQRDPEFMRHFDLVMNYHPDSDVPQLYLGYYGTAEKFEPLLRRVPRPKLKAPLAVALISSRYNASGRLDYLRELMRYLPIDSYGRFMRNQRATKSRNWHPEKLELIATYKFTIAFENAIDRDYVTEKFFDPLIAGSVPIYLGAPNIQQFAPGEHCYINAADFPNPRTLAAYLIQLARDERAYAEFFAWKEKPFRAEFRQLVAKQVPDKNARLYELVQARQSLNHSAK